MEVLRTKVLSPFIFSHLRYESSLIIIRLIFISVYFKMFRKQDMFMIISSDVSFAPFCIINLGALPLLYRNHLHCVKLWDIWDIDMLYAVPLRTSTVLSRSWTSMFAPSSAIIKHTFLIRFSLYSWKKSTFQSYAKHAYLVLCILILIERLPQCSIQ